MRTTIIVVLLLMTGLKAFASEGNRPGIHVQHNPDTVICTGAVADDSSGSVSSYHLTENKRIVAAILAFPPFGCLGLHRIYLGTDPWVPVVYVVTLGGCGLIALVDFVEICTADQPTFDSYSHNGKVFMWGK